MASKYIWTKISPLLTKNINVKCVGIKASLHFIHCAKHIWK